MKGQAEVRMAAFHPPLAVEGCAVSRMILCSREGGREGPVVPRGERRG